MGTSNQIVSSIACLLDFPLKHPLTCDIRYCTKIENSKSRNDDPADHELSCSHEGWEDQQTQLSTTLSGRDQVVPFDC